MDIGETYVKMCEKAVEIQPKDVLGSIGGSHQGGNIYYHTSSIKRQREKISSGFYYLMDEVYEDERNEEHHRQIKAVFIPRQDQLQEMVWLHTSGTYNLLPTKLFAFSDYWEENGIPNTFTSMEQLWLAYVMKEKYRKVWDGQDWVIST